MLRFGVVLILGLSCRSEALAQHQHASGEHCPECGKTGFENGAPGACDWGDYPMPLKVPQVPPSAFHPPEPPVETDRMSLFLVLSSAALGMVTLVIRRLQKLQ